MLSPCFVRLPVRVPKDSAKAFCRRADENGYDIGFFAHTDAGTLEVGMSFAENSKRQKTLGFFFNAPRVGKFFVALALTANGQIELTSVSRQKPNGTLEPEELTLPADDRLLALLLKQQADANLKRAKKAESLVEKQKKQAQKEVTRLLSDIAALQHLLKEKDRQQSERTDALQKKVAQLESELAISREMHTSRGTDPSPFDRTPSSAEENSDVRKNATVRYSLSALQAAKAVDKLKELPFDMGSDVEETEIQ